MENVFSEQHFAQHIFAPPPSPCIFKDFVLDIYVFFETNTQHIQIQMFLVDMIVVVDPFLALQRDLFFLADGLIVGLTHLARLNLHKAGAGGFEELQAWRTESKHQRNLLAHLRCRGWDVVLPIKNLHLYHKKIQRHVGKYISHELYGILGFWGHWTFSGPLASDHIREKCTTLDPGTDATLKEYTSNPAIFPAEGIDN